MFFASIVEYWNRFMAFMVAPIAALGSFLIIFPLTTLVMGQSTQSIITRSEYQIQELEKRADREDDKFEKLALALEGIGQRMAILETLQKGGGDRPWERGTSVGTGILLIEAVFRISSKRLNKGRRHDDDDDSQVTQ